jgi:hypothetical protein
MMKSGLADHARDFTLFQHEIQHARAHTTPKTIGTHLKKRLTRQGAPCQRITRNVAVALLRALRELRGEFLLSLLNHEGHEAHEGVFLCTTDDEKWFGRP